MQKKIAPYDAILVCSFGGPNKPEDVIPFLQNVTAGKNIPAERLAEVGEHYYGFGGKSPINEQNLALISSLKAEFSARGYTVPILWGNRNWHPYTVDTLRDAAEFGVRRVLTLVTSAYNSYSGSRQYREHLAAVRNALGEGAPQIDVLRAYFNNPGFVHANFAHIQDALAQLPQVTADTHIVYVTHSIPDTMQLASEATGPGYRQQHEDVRQVIDQLLQDQYGFAMPSSLAYCSRSGDPRTPWLEPDINDHIQELAAAGVTQLVIAPIGFVSDHMEVAYDLDEEALATAAERGVTAVRARTASVHPLFISGLVDMILERVARENGQLAQPVTVGQLPAFADAEPAGSCRMRHNEVTGIPVIAGTED